MVAFAQIEDITCQSALISLILANAEYDGLQMCILDAARSDKPMTENLDATTRKSHVTRSMADAFASSLIEKALTSFERLRALPIDNPY